jgi:GT2 family glycosyltransferase
MQTLPLSEPFISILITTRNNASDLIDCLKSIGNLDYPLSHMEIIIWDNNSESNCKKTMKEITLQLSKKEFANVKLIENNTNFGVYTSRDELLKLVNNDTQYILSIDDDVIVPPQLISELLPFFSQDRCIGIVGPRIVFDDDPTRTAHGAGCINWWLGKYYDRESTDVIECDYVIGCCMLIKKAVIDQVGGFDRDYYTSHGEVDFCLKAKKSGYKTLYYPNTVVRHRVERGGTQTLERKYYIFRNKLFVIKKNAPYPHKWFALTLYFLFWPAKNIFDCIKRNRRVDLQEIRTILRAITDGWLNRTGERF